MLLFVHAFAAEIPVGIQSFLGCWDDTSECPGEDFGGVLIEFKPRYWHYRTEIIRRMGTRSTGDLMERCGPSNDASSITCADGDQSCERKRLSQSLDRILQSNNACTAVFLHTGERSWATRACERGDVGSCLLDTLDALAAPATHDDALATLGTHCLKGSASACAWRLEHLREHPDPAVFPEAITMAQRACIELHEPVACAAAAKTLHTRGLEASAARLDQRACTLGYQPSCDPDPKRKLLDEQAPQIVGPTMLDQSNPEFPEPLPGRPPLPGAERLTPFQKSLRARR